MDVFGVYVSMISDNIYEVKRNIIKLYKKYNYYGLDDFISILGVEPLLIYFALNDIIDKRIKIINKNGKVGTIIYKNGIYVFISKNSSRFLSINNLRHKNTKKRIGSFNISRNNVLSQLGKNNKSAKIKWVVEKTLDKEIEDIKGDVELILKEFPEKNSILSDILDIKMTADILDMINKLNKYYIDFMDVNDKEKLTKYLIYKSLTSKLNKLEKTIASTLSTILYFKNDVYFEDILYKGPEKIWGYKKINGKKLEYRRYDDRENKFVPATEEEIKQIHKSFKKKIKTIPKSSNIIGYYELRNNQTIPDFKIRERPKTNSDEVTKGSHIKTGSVCNNDGMKKAKIVSYIEKILDSKIDSDWPIKGALCKYLELILRHKDITDDSHRHFYGPEETIEYKLNEKS